MSSLDTILFGWLNSWAGVNPWWDTLIIFRAGYLLYIIVAALSLFAIFSYLPKFRYLFKRNAELFLLAAISAAFARYGLTFFIRFFYNRPRPFETLEGVRQLIPHAIGGSFPSGHAAAAFAIATTVFFYYPKTSILFFLAAVMIGIGRISAGVHWPSDVLGGAIIGVGSAWLVRFLYQRAHKKIRLI